MACSIQLRARAYCAYEMKYQIRPDTASATGPIYCVQPRVALAWLESDFPGGATRWVLDDRG